MRKARRRCRISLGLLLTFEASRSIHVGSLLRRCFLTPKKFRSDDNFTRCTCRITCPPRSWSQAEVTSEEATKINWRLLASASVAARRVTKVKYFSTKNTENILKLFASNSLHSFAQMKSSRSFIHNELNYWSVISREPIKRFINRRNGNWRRRRPFFFLSNWKTYTCSLTNSGSHTPFGVRARVLSIPIQRKPGELSPFVR